MAASPHQPIRKNAKDVLTPNPTINPVKIVNFKIYSLDSKLCSKVHSRSVFQQGMNQEESERKRNPTASHEALKAFTKPTPEEI